MATGCRMVFVGVSWFMRVVFGGVRASLPPGVLILRLVVVVLLVRLVRLGVSFGVGYMVNHLSTMLQVFLLLCKTMLLMAVGVLGQLALVVQVVVAAIIVLGVQWLHGQGHGDQDRGKNNNLQKSSNAIRLNWVTIIGKDRELKLQSLIYTPIRLLSTHWLYTHRLQHDDTSWDLTPLRNLLFMCKLRDVRISTVFRNLFRCWLYRYLFIYVAMPAGAPRKPLYRIDRYMVAFFFFWER